MFFRRVQARSYVIFGTWLTLSRFYNSLPKQIQKALDQANPEGSIGEKTYDTALNKSHSKARPATSHGDRPSLKQIISEKKKEVQKTSSASNHATERPKSAAPTHDLGHPAAHSERKAALPAKPVRPTSKAITVRPKITAAPTVPAAPTVSTGTGTLLSAPKRPNHTRKPLTAATFIPTDATAEPAETTTETNYNVAATGTVKENAPLGVLTNPPGSKLPLPVSDDDPVVEETGGPKPSKGIESEGERAELTVGVVRVLSSLVSDTGSAPENAYDVLRRSLKSSDVNMRRAGIELGVTLYKHEENPTGFWAQLGPLESGGKDLLMYFIAKSA